MNKQQENLKRKIQTTKKKKRKNQIEISEMKHTISKMKNLLDENNRLWIVK